MLEVAEADLENAGESGIRTLGPSRAAELADPGRSPPTTALTDRSQPLAAVPRLQLPPPIIGPHCRARFDARVLPEGSPGHRPVRPTYQPPETLGIVASVEKIQRS
jgi:hypothetical protein